jgi:hypothetical protein
LDELFIVAGPGKAGRLGKCVGERPWIGDREPNCAAELRLLTRSATNTYFSQVATVISLPLAEDEITKLVSQVMTRIQWVTEGLFIHWD